MENKTPNYYAIIPADVRYDERLKANEKLMYGEITCLSNKLGYCFSSNNYFSELYNVTPQAISGWIKNLERCGYITCEYLHNGTEIKERRIRMTNSRNDEKGNSTKFEKGINETLKGYKQNFKDNNTSDNNTRTNTTRYIPKHKNGTYQNVLLSDKEIEKLNEELGTDKAKAVIDNFSELKEMKGYKYKSDYLALKKWGIEAYNKNCKPVHKEQYTDEEYKAGSMDPDKESF